MASQTAAAGAGTVVVVTGCAAGVGMGLDERQTISSLTPGGPAATCGLELGDTVLSVDGVTLAGKTVDVRAEAVDTGQGRTNAQSIRAAASEGFASRSYKRVYRRYRTVAEEHVAKESIPDGKRAYIRRYFQLIRPRE